MVVIAFTVAKEKGYYREERLEVEIICVGNKGTLLTTLNYFACCKSWRPLKWIPAQSRGETCRRNPAWLAEASIPSHPELPRPFIP